MVRETRHLWVGNLPDNIREDRIRDHFKRYGRVQNVKLLPRGGGSTEGGTCAAVAFMDIKSAAKAHNGEHVLDERTLTTEYYEPAAIPSTASAGSSPAGSGYSASSGSVNSAPRYQDPRHTSVEEPTSVAAAVGCAALAGGAAAAAAGAAAGSVSTWRGTNDSGAADYCRRGNTPAYSRYSSRTASTPVPAPYATPPSTLDRTPHHRWYSNMCGGSSATGAGESSAPSTPGGAEAAPARRRRRSDSGAGSQASSRSSSSSGEPSTDSRASTPTAGGTASAHRLHPPSQWSSASGRPLAICVRNLPIRSSDSSLKDGLYHEYKKHGKVAWVKIIGANADRYAVVRFKKPSDVEKALEVSQDKLFFGCKITVAPHQGCELEDGEPAKPYETDLDEYHPKATRTLFIGNLEKEVTLQQLRDKFKHFGRIIEIDIKKQSGGAGYAFCQYASISSVVDAIRAMDGEYVGSSRVKLGFGKSLATTCVWIDGLTEQTEKQVLAVVARCGAATSVCVDRSAGAALVHFEQAAAAAAAVRELRRVAAAAQPPPDTDRRLMVDFASRECQDAFYEQLEKHGGNGTAALANAELRLPADLTARYTRHDSLSRYEGAGSRSRAASYNRSSSRTPRYNALSDHYDPADYTADRRYRVYDEFGSCSPADVEALGSGAGYEESRSLQSVVVASPRRRTARHHRRRSRDSTPDEQGKMRKESRRSGGGRRSSGEARHRSRSGSRSERRRRPSDAERRRHRRRREESGGSRAGTPLCDELPEGLAPAEPRRPPLPRDRTQAMSLPLPKFAAQVLRSIPIHTPPPAPAPMAPASPPRAPSASSSSGGSAPHSPSLEERIRSLDEKYEKWSGSRAAAAEAAERGRFRHRLLEIDIKEVKPSEVVRSLLAKRSVFDEDSERLEGAAAFEKRAPSPSSSGSPRGREPRAAPRALQYPFPTHPPLPASAPLPEEPPPDAQERVPANGTPVRTVLREKMTIETVKSEFKKSFVECSEATSRTIGDSSESSSERPDGPRPNRTEHFSVNQVKLEDIKLEVKSEPGVRIRTPSTDKSHPDSVDTKCLEKTDRDRTDHDRDPRRDSDRKRQEGIVTENEKLHEREQEKVIYSETARTDLENENASCDKSHADFSEHSNKDKIALEDEQCSIDMERHIEEQLNLEKQQRLREALLDKSDKSSQEQHLNNPDSENLEKEKFDKAEKEKTQQEKLEKEQLDRERIEKENSARDKAEKECSAREKAEKERSEREKIEKERLEQAKAENERIKCQKESLEREKAEKERKERVRMEAEKLEKERHSRVKQEKEQLEKEKMERERLEHEKQKAERDIAEKEKHEKIRIEKEKALQEKLEKEKKLKEDAEKEKIEREKLEKEKNEKERLEKERVKTEKDQERLEKEKSERETDKEKHSEDKVNRHESKKDKSDKDKRKEELTEVDIFNHSSNKPRKDEKHKHDRHRKEHSEQRRESKKENETKSRDISRKSSRDESSREMQRKDSSDSTASRASHDSTKYKDVDTEVKDDAKHSSSRHKHSHEYNHKHKTEKETSPRITDAPRKNDNDKHHDKSKERESKGQEQIPKDKVESHGDKQRHYSLDSQNSLDVETKRKDRLNSSSSLPSNLGLKRRMSSQDSLESMAEESKKPKIDKVLERRDSKDCKNNEKSKTPKFNKLHFAKLLESKIKDDKKNQVKPPDDKLVDWKDIINKDQKLHNNDKSRAGKSPKSVHDEKSSTPPVDTKLESDSNQDTPFRDLDFLATLELRSSEEDEKQKALRKEMKEKKRIHQLQQIQELQMQQDAMQQGDKMKDDKRFKNEDRKKEAAREKRMSTERKSREEAKIEVKKKIRKPGNSSDTSDSDEPKKHSIFDIVDDGPTYISMYDKVKARSCKNMQKQEEEKRQEKIKAKFSQLKQSRAKREEKKRSTSWDEDSDSDQERKKFSQKHSMVSSSDDDRSVNRHQRQDNITDSENDYENIRKMEKICYYNETINDEDARNKLSRKLSRSRIMSDTSDDDSIKRSINKSLQNHVEIKKEICSDTEMPPIDYFTKKNRETKKEFNSFKREDDEGRFTKDAFIKLFNAKFDNLDDKKTIKPEISKFEALADKIIKSEAITDHIIKPTLCATVKLDNDFKINQLKSLCNDFSSEGELSSRYTGSEIRKKHKKKQKKQKPMLSEDENKSTDYSEQSPVLSGEIKHRRNSDKTRKHNNKKEKRKEKLRDSLDSEDFREDKTKSKKGKKSTSVGFENKIDSDASAIRREEKMEDIFGPLSDESDAGAKSSNVHNNFGINKLPGNIMSNDKYNFMLKDKELEESRRRKERKRKEKRFIAKEDENSLDVDAAGKAIEASLFADSVPENDNQNARTGPLENTIKSEQDIFSFTDGDDNTETSMINSELKQAADKLRKEAKEKKKKKKKNKEDRQNRKDHHHHHGKIDKVERYADESNSILDIPILVKEVEILSKSEPDIKSKEECKPAMQSPSLPRLTDSPPLVIDELPESPKSIVECPAHDILKIENDKEPITKSEEKNEELKNSTPVIKTDPEQTGDVSSSSPKPLAKPEKYIPGFGGEIDKNISDSAVKSISEFDKPKDPSVDNKLLDSSSGQNKIDEKEEKQRAVISQEETEDAVAALLGESFGQNDDAFNSCFNEVEDSSSAQVEGTSLESENILEEDAEEMRQAVQNLNASELEIKPDTPMSENDLQIDTDTEEPDDVTPENVEKPAVTSLSMTISTSTSSGTDRTNKIEPPKLPSNTVINTSASVKINSDLLKPLSLPTLTSLPKLNDIKSDQPQSDFLPIKREGFQQITSTATPVISTAWTISGNKLREPHLINVHANHSVTRDDKPPQLPANVVQLKSSISQELMLNMQQRPLINAQAGMNPSFIINQMLRPGQVTNLQPPTIKIPEPHIMYQKQSGIVISPRMVNDVRLQSPKSSPQSDTSSPRLTILSPTPQNMGLASPNSLQQRSPGQHVTVVRMQQPPLSPIQTMHLPHGNRTMVSPNTRPNSVLVQAQSTPLHINRLPVTPVLAPLSKPMHPNNILQQQKSIHTNTMTNSNAALIPTQKFMTEMRKNQEMMDNSKLIMSPSSSLQQNTVMAQNRLIMQNPANLNAIHLANNKILFNNSGTLSDKRDIANMPFKSDIGKSEPLNKSTYGQPPIIHLANINKSTSPIIHTGPKPVITVGQDQFNVNRPHISNIVHTMNSHRLLTTVPMTSVIQGDLIKPQTSSVLTMASIRPQTVLTRFETPSNIPFTSSVLSNVMMTPPLVRASGPNIYTKPIMSSITATTSSDIRKIEPVSLPQYSASSIPNREDNLSKFDEKTTQNIPPRGHIDVFKETINKLIKIPVPTVTTVPQKQSLSHTITKCETDFEELLKDNTNEIKVTKEPDRKVEVNVAVREPITSYTSNQTESIVNPKPSDDKNDSINPAVLEKHLEVQPKAESIDENKEESEGWSAKEVNIESVIKKVDDLCKNQDPVEDKPDVIHTETKPSIQSNIKPVESKERDESKPMELLADPLAEVSEFERIGTNKCRGGRSSRGRKSDKQQDRVQTRQISKPARGTPASRRGRGGRAKVDKKTKSIANAGPILPGDVYDFHDDSGDETATSHQNKNDPRPRLILTIKSPINGPANIANATATVSVGVTSKEQPQTAEKAVNEKPASTCKETGEDFLSPAPNTRKSRRLQEKDGNRNTVDEVIEDVIKNSSIQTKGSTKDGNSRRNTRQAGTKSLIIEKSGIDVRKSPRGGKRTRDRSSSETSMDSSDEKTLKKDELTPPESKIPKLSEPIITVTKPEPDSNIIMSVSPTVTATTVPATTVIATTVVATTVISTTTVVVQPILTVAPSIPPPVSTSAPIMKPPKKMISEISAKLASAFEVVPKPSLIPVKPKEPECPTAVGPERMIQDSPDCSVHPIGALPPHFEKPVETPDSVISTHIIEEVRPTAIAETLKDSALAPTIGEIGFQRRVEAMPPGGMAMSGIVDDADTRVQSPALPHRPPAMHRTADRTTPIIRACDSEASSVAVLEGCRASPARAGAVGAVGPGARAYRTPYSASLPRGAHHPPPLPAAHPALPSLPSHPAHHHLKHVAIVGPQPPHLSPQPTGATNRITHTSVPSVSPQGPILGDSIYPHFSHQHYQVYQQHFRATQHETRATASPYTRSPLEEGSEAPTPPLELRRPPSARVPPPVPRPAHSPSPADRLISVHQFAPGGRGSPPPAHGGTVVSRLPSALPPPGPPGPPHASQVPREADSLQMLLRRYPVMWQGLLALKNDGAAVQMHFVHGNHAVASHTLPRHMDGSTPPLRIAQRMRLEPVQLEAVHRKMQMESEHCMLLALPCGRDHMDVLQQSTNLTAGFITYLQRKQAAGIVNVAPPGHHQAMYTVHIFPSCDFANENLNRIAPDLLHRVADIAHLLIVIATV